MPHTVFARRHCDTLGGTSAGKAPDLASWGVPVTLSTVLGDDAEGVQAREHLGHEHIDLVAETSPGGTDQHLDLMDADGGRVSIYLQIPQPPYTVVHEEASTTTTTRRASTGPGSRRPT